MKLLIAIPAYNEASMIGKIIEKIPKRIKGIKTIKKLVIDDGSSDETGQIAEKKKVKVIRHLLNRGLGGAIKTIIEYSKYNNFDITVTLDADGQHNPKDIDRIIKPIQKKQCDVVIASRWLKKAKSPFSRYMANQLANGITALLVGVYSTDSQSGMRVFNKKAIRQINIQTDGMEVSSEVLKEIKRNKLKLKEVPIEPVYTKYSKLKGQKLSDAPDVLFRLIIRLLQ